MAEGVVGNDTKRTNAQAKARCLSDGALLAMPKDRTELDDIRYFAGNLNDGWFVGLSQIEVGDNCEENDCHRELVRKYCGTQKSYEFSLF